jgi:hypothetical protein
MIAAEVAASSKDRNLWPASRHEWMIFKAPHPGAGS